MVRKRKSEKMNIFQRQTLTWKQVQEVLVLVYYCIYIVWCDVSVASADTQVQDHYKNIIYKTPSQVEVCYDRQVSGDKTGDTIMGAIIGGAIGNNVTKNLPDGGTAGAILGGLLGNMNSDASGGTRTVCKTETRYKEESKTMYSHSTINFEYHGKIYTLKFKK